MDINLYQIFGTSAKDIIKEMLGLDIRGMDTLEQEPERYHPWECPLLLPLPVLEREDF